MSDAITLTHSQAVNRLKDIDDELERLQGKEQLTPEDEKSFSELTREFDDLDEHRKKMERDAERARVKAVREGLRNGTVRVDTPAPGGSFDRDEWLEPDDVDAKRFRDPWDLSEIRTFDRSSDELGHELRSRAFSAIEKMPYASDKVREASTRLLEDPEVENPTRVAQLILNTSSPDYTRAFTKYMKHNGQLGALTPDESRLMQRAMSLTDSAGGYLIPFQLDPTVILTANGSLNEIRQVARTVNATGDVWSGISSAGVTGSWDAEAAEVSDDAPTFAQPAIPVYKGAIFVPISIEAQQDESNVAGEVARMVAFEKDRMESVAFVTGSGSGEPTGIVTALTGTGSVVNSATTDTFAIADVYALDSALPARYAANATWLAHRAIYNLVRRFDTSGGAGLWTTLGNGMPERLLGQRVITAEGMDSTITALAANPVAVYGDFSNYVIADRVGTTIEYIPHLFGTNRRPTGQRGWYAYFRVGADSVNDAAFRMLDVT